MLLLLALSSINITAQNFSDDNFIYIARPKKAVSVDDFTTLQKDEVIQNLTYFDGLGRPVQTIAIGQGGDGSDLITPIEYDGFGRQEKDYLPFSLPNSNNQYPRIDTQTAINNVISFYSDEKYDNTANPFSKKQFENSPLNRILKQAAPGNDWIMGGGREIKIEYQTNTADEVRLFEVISSWDASSGLYDISIWDSGFYDKNELYKTITYDENSEANPSEKNGSTVEFKDKEGRVVLKRTYNDKQPHDTYYVYDEYGNLTYVIPPKADREITEEILNNLCYQYKYDNRNRLVEKKIPGKQWEFIVYDRLNRAVATGPANSPFQEDKAVGWLITKYDALGRQIYTGWDSKACNSSERFILQQAYNTENPVLESAQKTGTIEGIQVQDNNVPSSGFKLLTATYYDYNSAITASMTVQGQQVLFNNARLVTGSWTRLPTTVSAVLGETSSIFYDMRWRPIATYTTNYLGGYTKTENKLDFTGKTLLSVTSHKISSNAEDLNTIENFSYSAQDRLLTHTHQLNTGTEQLLTNNTYDVLGRLISKNVGNTVGAPFQKIDYKYNIRGWLTDINNIENLQQDSDTKDLFALKINYNKVEGSTAAAKELYNGNIAETFGASGSDGSGVVRGYGYQYDQLNRLNEATFQAPKLTDNKNYFGENLDYDKNGNITHLQRNFMAGVLSNPYADYMDNLGYFYKDNSNQLMKVTDTSNNPQGFKDDSDGYNDNEDDYAYDDNGNLTKDQNKNITGITYNHLNLPIKITFASGDTIDYIYNAAGQKAEKNVTENGVVTNTKYLSGFQYKNDVLQFFPTAEGYVRNTSTNPATYKFDYVFNYTDHLGNVRLSYAQNAEKNGLEILEENNYYPFGLKHQGYNSDNKQPNYKYKYNNKELQDELGLAVYDYGARFYDPATGRWYTMDAMAEKYSEMSPYNYALNNPVIFVDPDGNEVEMCCDGLKAFVLTAVDDSFGTDYRNQYDNGSTAYHNGVMSAHASTMAVGAFMMADGAMSATAGTTGLLASGAVAATGIGAPAGAIGATGSGLLLAKGVVEGVAGSIIAGNAASNMISDSKVNGNSSEKSNGGRSGKQKRLEEVGNDPKTSSADRGWIKQEKNSIDRKSTRQSKDGTLKPQKNIRNPPGKDLAHPYKKPAREGNSYKDAKLKNTADHRTEHKIHGYK